MLRSSYRSFSSKSNKIRLVLCDLSLKIEAKELKNSGNSGCDISGQRQKGALYFLYSDIYTILVINGKTHSSAAMP